MNSGAYGKSKFFAILLFFETEKMFDEMKSSKGEMKKRFGEMKSPKGEMKKRFGEMKSSKGEMEKRFGEMKSSKGEMKKRFGEMKSSKGEMGKRFGEMKSPKGEMEKRFDEMKSPKGEMEKMFDEMKSAKGETKSEIAGAAEIVSVWPEEMISGSERWQTAGECRSLSRNLILRRENVPQIFSAWNRLFSKRLAQGCPHGLKSDGDWV